MQRIKQGILLGMLMVAIFMMGGCQAKTDQATDAGTSTQKEVTAEKTTYPLTLKDGSGVDITFEKAPSVVVSLSPSSTEIMFALGKGDILKGRTKYCDYPAEALAVAEVGSIMKPNVEAIVAIKPDVVFVSGMFSAEMRTKIEGLGIKVFDLSSHDTFDGVYEAIGNAGKILDTAQTSEKLIADMKTTVSDVQEKVKGAQTKSAYYVVGFGESGDYTAGKGTFIDQIITLAGGVNAANDVEGWSYSLEKLIEKDPEFMICRNGGEDKKGIEATNGYKDLTAVKEGRLIEIDSDLLDIQGPRSAEGVLALAKILHPELFK